MPVSLRRILHRLAAPRSSVAGVIGLSSLIGLSTLVLLAQPASALASAPESTPSGIDEVRLPGGGFSRGRVGELVPGRHVVIIKPNGEQRRFEWSEIESIVLSDGTVYDHSTTPTAMPEPEPEPEPEPMPEPEPEPELEPEPEPEPVPFDVDSLEPEPEPEPEPEVVADKPTTAKPRVLISPDTKGPKLALQRVTSGGSVGDKLAMDAKTKLEMVCEEPCEQLVERPGDLFTITTGKQQVGRSFRLGTTHSSYEVTVRRKSPIKLWSGVALIPATLLIGIGIGIIPRLHNVPNQKIGAYAAGATLIALAGAGGGVTLILFSFDKVKVLPGVRG